LEQTIGPIFNAQAFQARPLKVGPIGCPETSVTINLRCVIFQKSGDLIYTTGGSLKSSNGTLLCSVFIYGIENL